MCADERVETGACFQWQSQMRYAVNEKTKLSQVRVPARVPDGTLAGTRDKACLLGPHSSMVGIIASR